MADGEKLRALLAEAREWVPEAQEWPSDPQCDLLQRIDAALAESVGTVIDWRSFLVKAEKERDEALALVQSLSGAWQGEQISLMITETTLALALKQRDEARAEVERLRGAKPELPPRPPFSGGLPRYGLRWNGPVEPIAVPMDDGYWTPWHLADAAYQRGAEAMREAAASAVHDCHTAGLLTPAAVTAAVRVINKSPVPEDKP